MFPTHVNPPEVGGQQPPTGMMARLGRMFDDGGDGSTPPEAPTDPYKDYPKILKFCEARKKECLENRWVYERIWWRNVLYLLGRQWVYYDRKRGQWLDKRMAKWIPRPVTNVIARTANIIKSVFQAVDLSASARPNSTDERSVSTATTIDRMEPLLKALHDRKRVQRESDFWYIVTGNLCEHVWWNPFAKSILKPWKECLGCTSQYRDDELNPALPICEVCGGGEFQPAEDEYGYPVGDETWEGSGCTDSLSPFEWAIPPAYTRVDDSPVLTRMRWRTKAFCEEHYEKKLLTNLVWSKAPTERSLSLLKAIAQQSDVTSTPITYAGDDGTQEGIVEYEIWHRPCKDYKHGLVARVLGESNGVLVVSQEEALPGPMPYRTAEGVALFPFNHAVYEDIGGRLNGRGAVDVIMQKQDQINQLDSMSQLCEQRMANPVWLEPKGAEVKSFTGEPGLVVKYNPNVAGGNAKPERIAGQNIPSSLFERRAMLFQDCENMTGTNDVLQGVKPAGIDAFAAIQALIERSQSYFGPALAARGEAYRKWLELAVELERQYGPEKRIVAVLRPDRTYRLKEFMNADIQGQVTYHVEDGSQLPKTPLGMRAAIQHGQTLGVLNPQDPEQQYEIMRKLGIAELAPSLDVSTQGALREQSLFEDWVGTLQPIPLDPMNPEAGASIVDPAARLAMAPKPVTVEQPVEPAPGDEGGQPQTQAVTQMVAPPAAQQTATLFPGSPLVVKPWQKHAIHIAKHDIFCQSDEYLELVKKYPELDELWGLHRQAHLEAWAQDQMQMAMLTQPMQPGQGAGMAMANSNQNAGAVPASSPQGAPVH